MREEEGQGKCEARQRGTPTGCLPRRDAPQTPRVPWWVCQPGSCAPLARPPGERCSQLSHGKERGEELPAHLPVGERSVPRALAPQQCTQNAKPRTLRPGLSSKARRGGRSQRSCSRLLSPAGGSSQREGPTRPGSGPGQFLKMARHPGLANITEGIQGLCSTQ